MVVVLIVLAVLMVSEVSMALALILVVFVVRRIGVDVVVGGAEGRSRMKEDLAGENKTTMVKHGPTHT